MHERSSDPKPDSEAEAADLDTANEPEPDWAEGIRRGRRQRAEQLRELLADSADEERDT